MSVYGRKVFLYLVLRFAMFSSPYNVQRRATKSHLRFPQVYIWSLLKWATRKRVDSAKMAKLNIYCILMSDHLRLCQSRLCPRTLVHSSNCFSKIRYPVCLTQQTVAEFQTFGLSLSLGQYGCLPASTANHLGGFPFSYL